MSNIQINPFRVNTYWFTVHYPQKLKRKDHKPWAWGVDAQKTILWWWKNKNARRFFFFSSSSFCLWLIISAYSSVVVNRFSFFRILVFCEQTANAGGSFYYFLRAFFFVSFFFGNCLCVIIGDWPNDGRRGEKNGFEGKITDRGWAWLKSLNWSWMMGEAYFIYINMYL